MGWNWHVLRQIMYSEQLIEFYRASIIDIIEMYVNISDKVSP